MLLEDVKKAIDAMSYEDMLYRWRHGKDGDPFFQGEVGEYFSTEMAKKRNECSDAVAVSKRIGW